MALGLAPCSTPTDPEYAQYQQLKCTPQFGGHFERADRTFNAMFAAYEFPVPPTFTLPKNGVYAPLKPVTDEKYMPFVAAYMFCQHLLQRTQVPISTGTQVTVDVTSAGARADQEAKSSTAYSMCMDDLAERMQYDSSNPAFKINHQSQADSCMADTNAGIMDSNTCATDGRSDLQGMHDRAYRDGTTSYHAKFLLGASRDTIIAETAQLINGKIAFRDYVMKERQALAAAISASSAGGSVGSSPLSLPVTASPGH